MLASTHRLTSPAHYREVVRRGRRTGGPLIVVHLLAPATGAQVPTPVAAAVPTTVTPPDTSDAGEPKVGFVVSKAVGPAVTRNLVKRRLRHLARERVAELPDASLLVVRALPASARASYQELGVELDRCLRKVGVR